MDNKKLTSDKKLVRKDKLAQASQAVNKREIDHRLDVYEKKIEELRILFEQYFADVHKFPPDKEKKATERMMRELLKAPFKQSSHSFRLRQLVSRYQTYDTYWTRTLKLREEGKYFKDLFKAGLREKEFEEVRKAATREGKAEKGFQQLFDSYEKTVRKSGGSVKGIDYLAFKKSLVKQAKTLKQRGVSKVSYKIVVKDGKTVVKAVAKKK